MKSRPISSKALGIREQAKLPSRRMFILRAALLGGMVALGPGSYLYGPRRPWAADPIKIGVATGLTGAVSGAGIPNANVAKMVIDDINASGGLLGRPLQLVLEDTATDEALAVAK